MKRLFVKSDNKFASRLTALFLLVWLSGAACLLSCGAMQVRAALTEHHQHTLAAQVVEESSCQMGGHSCCHGKTKEQPQTDKEKLSVSSPSKQIPTLDCCSPLHFVQINQAQIVKQTETAVLTPAAAVEPLKPAFKNQKVSFHSAYQPIPLNRGSTHLRNCVFRI